jgi:hypothetical protein
MLYNGGSQSGLYRPRRGSGLTRGAMEVGPSERLVRLFTVEETSDQTLGNG